MGIIIKTPAVIKEVVKHSDSLVSYKLIPEKPIFKFKPGQYLHLALDEYDPSRPWPESRAFSIANSPLRKGEIRITASVKGTFTRRMYAHLKESDLVWIKLPYGAFSFETGSHEMILIAGGTGITPFISFIEYVRDKHLLLPIKLFYGFKKPELCIFDNILQEFEKEIPSFKKYYFIEAPSDSNSIKGQLDVDQILNLTENTHTAQFYVSGPPRMIFAFRKKLVETCVDFDRIHIDDWE